MIGLVACSKSKLPYGARADALYSSALFKLSLAYAQRHCTSIYIVSALHGLLALDAIVRPYERTLSDYTAQQRLEWGAGVAGQLFKQHGTDIASSTPVMFLAGAAYVAPIVERYQAGDGAMAVVDVMRGMQIGQRLSYLTAQLGRRAA